MEMMGLLLLVAIAATAGETLLSWHDCPEKCGAVDIPYPFGVGDHCSLNTYFNLTCDHSTSTLYYRTSNIKVLNISLDAHHMDISMYVARLCHNQSGGEDLSHSVALLRITAFPISSSENKFVSVGCDSFAFLKSFQGERIYTTGCLSQCDQLPPPVYDGGETCSGAGCCHVDIPPRMKNITVQSFSFDTYRNVSAWNNCSYAFVAKQGSFNFFPHHLQHPIETSQLVLDWSIVDEATFQQAPSRSKPKPVSNSNTSCKPSTSGFGYRCFCKLGFHGNPYLPNGCRDVNECVAPNNCDLKAHALCNNFIGGYNCSCLPGYKGDGYVNGTRCTLETPLHSNPRLLPLIIALGACVTLLVGFTLVSTLCWAHKQRTLKQIRHRNFEQNGGNMLLQSLSQQQGYADRTKIFTQVELQNATNNFDEDRILGRGGQGTVYKGILPDNTPVAIKMSKVGGDPRQIKDFINEVVVLSQINHRNVVKLLGCCLETEVPLLVYEFVENGTLLDHIDPSNNKHSISWEIRLGIAAEIAEAISYLHSAASIPIIHRDIKSTNILLDDKHKVKVSDFGASRLVALDETQVATVVQGTLGYLDPEYLLTGQLNEKSDVYSFGVVLIELLTRKKAVEFNRLEQPNLAMYFVSSIKEDRLWEILDKQLLDQKKNAKQLQEVAFLARRCVRINGEERPTMKEVAMELEGLIAMDRHPWVKGGDDAMAEETEYLLVHVPDGHGGASTSNSSGYDTIQKHLTFEIADGR